MGGKGSGAGGGPGKNGKPKVRYRKGPKPPRVKPKGGRRPAPIQRVVRRGAVQPEDLEKAIPRGTPNGWRGRDGRLDEGFSYTFEKKGETFVVHGHGPDDRAPAGKPAAVGPIVRVKRKSDGLMHLSTSGKWVADTKANAEVTHIPLNRRKPK